MTEDCLAEVPASLLDGECDSESEDVKPWWYAGGRKPEHRKKPVVKQSPFGVNEAYRAISDIILPPSEKALLLVLFKRVSSVTWRFPAQHGDPGGVSMKELGASIERSERTARRLMRKLEARGLVTTFDRRPDRNEYQIEAKALIDAGKAGRAAVKQTMAEHKAQRKALQDIAEQDIETTAKTKAAKPSTKSADADAKNDESAESAHPPWARKRARALGTTPAMVSGIVRAAWEAAGARGMWINEGAECRNATKVWQNLGEPTLEEWTGLVNSLASAAKAGRLNGRLSRGWTLSTKSLIRLASDGVARNLAASLAAESSTPQPELPAREREEPGAIDLPGVVVPGRVFEPWETGGRQQLRQQLGVMFDVWISPLVDGGHDGDCLVLNASCRAFAENVAANYGEVLVEAAGGPVRLVWG